jgi:hypothetical protein
LDLWLLADLLPKRWQRAIDDEVSSIFCQFFDQSKITHPVLEQELDKIRGFRAISYTLWGMLVIGDTALIFKTWRAVKRKPSST